MLNFKSNTQSKLIFVLVANKNYPFPTFFIANTFWLQRHYKVARFDSALDVCRRGSNS